MQSEGYINPGSEARGALWKQSSGPIQYMVSVVIVGFASAYACKGIENLKVTHPRFHSIVFEGIIPPGLWLLVAFVAIVIVGALLRVFILAITKKIKLLQSLRAVNAQTTTSPTATGKNSNSMGTVTAASQPSSFQKF